MNVTHPVRAPALDIPFPELTRIGHAGFKDDTALSSSIQCAVHPDMSGKL